MGVLWDCCTFILCFIIFLSFSTIIFTDMIAFGHGKVIVMLGSLMEPRHTSTDIAIHLRVLTHRLGILGLNSYAIF
jgi:hypothetical protein